MLVLKVLLISLGVRYLDLCFDASSSSKYGAILKVCAWLAFDTIPTLQTLQIWCKAFAAAALWSTPGDDLGFPRNQVSFELFGEDLSSI